ncbi:hypothetical protein PUN28_000115 [Cardiocondyla obscurior]|uniref:HEPN domain-containing protein n=1 Tax=Cardiocondyla obscurior TaxID=286306 RepID=A0AAW2GXU4_9HYME
MTIDCLKNLREAEIIFSKAKNCESHIYENSKKKEKNEILSVWQYLCLCSRIA